MENIIKVTIVSFICFHQNIWNGSRFLKKNSRDCCFSKEDMWPHFLIRCQIKLLVKFFKKSLNTMTNTLKTETKLKLILCLTTLNKLFKIQNIYYKQTGTIIQVYTWDEITNWETELCDDVSMSFNILTIIYVVLNSFALLIYLLDLIFKGEKGILKIINHYDSEFLRII